VPQDISVIGFDDIPLAAFQEPPLTTLHQDVFAIGKEAARLLIARVEQPETPLQHVLLSAELVVRESTGLVADGRRRTADRRPQIPRHSRVTPDPGQAGPGSLADRPA
jgi:LacI family transcriptional regulator